MRATVPGTSGRQRPDAATLVVCLLMLVYAGYNGWLVVMRHETFGTNAMDMGYTDQVVWNTLHGRILQFTTLENARIDLPLSEFRRTDTLLAYHVELLLVPLSLLYLFWSSPLMLLLFQVAVITSGAWPLYLLARQHLQSGWAGAAFALAYLLAPAVQGALLSDFHAVSLTACLLIWAMDLIERERWRALAAIMVVSLLAKEDVSLVVGMLGLWLIVAHHERRRGAAYALAGLFWLGLCMLVILPHYNGLEGSPFMGRLAIFGPGLSESVEAAARQPMLILQWLWRPEIRAYLGGLAASGGWLALFSPLTLAIAAPPLAMNVFSTWAWTYSGGEHYSATIIPIVMVSSLFGMERLARIVQARTGQPAGRVVSVLCVALLLGAGAHAAREGVWPLPGRFTAPRISEHVGIGHAIIATIPEQAAVSAQSGLYPHISQRERAYFFPAVNAAEYGDADYILLDVTGTSYPLTVKDLYREANRLMLSGGYGIVTAWDGYLLLEREQTHASAGPLPAAFRSFALGDPGQIRHPVQARFGESLELIGYDLRRLNVVSGPDIPIQLTLWWRVREELERDVQFPIYFTNEEGAIVYVYDGQTSATLWHPPANWEAGDVTRMETPVLTAGGLQDVLVAVVPAGDDVWDRSARYAVTTGSAASGQVLDEGTLFRLTTLL